MARGWFRSRDDRPSGPDRTGMIDRPGFHSGTPSQRAKLATGCDKAHLDNRKEPNVENLVGWRADIAYYNKTGSCHSEPCGMAAVDDVSEKKDDHERQKAGYPDRPLCRAILAYSAPSYPN